MFRFYFKVKISFENNFKGIANINEMKISFNSKQNSVNTEFYFQGYN
ncbi:hypothetical protein [Clostridium septicum]|uniref:Uncharacterized protein n=1 Tax=Clostridium septicum TaxID=1504 RepID=A0ABY5B2X6_CLOSE|nr:hypothetical protein [Clostridium septicum]USS01591.1 hypothetical protein NH397_03890 [Clostridium septicum]